MSDNELEKTYIRAQELLADSFRLAALVHESGFRPHCIVGIWRGGSPVGVAVQEYFAFRGVAADHFAIRASSYSTINEQAETVRVDGLQYLVDNLGADDPLLLVDDVFDSGKSIRAVVDELSRRARRNRPREVRVACPWYKPGNSKVDLAPDYYLRETDKWLIFPHELVGLTVEEIRKHKRDLEGLCDLLVAPEEA